MRKRRRKEAYLEGGGMIRTRCITLQRNPIKGDMRSRSSTSTATKGEERQGQPVAKSLRYLRKKKRKERDEGSLSPGSRKKGARVSSGLETGGQGKRNRSKVGGGIRG